MIRYSEDATLALPTACERGDVWVVNGEKKAVVDWDVARSAARQRECDVLVFDSPDPVAVGRQYSESVRVDETGRVVRFRRHYADSPTSADPWCESASVLVCSGANARAVVAHLAIHGWGLDSIGGLTRRFYVGWSDSSNGRTMNERAAALCVRSTDDKKEDSVAAWSSTLPGNDRTYRFVKRAMDIALSAVVLILLFPFLLVVAALVRLTSRGPAMFGHKRQGLGGKEFLCLKLRTMIEGADAMQAGLWDENEVDGPQFKITDDPRFTRLGAWLRRYNVDEVPQFINVLRGDMSLVGPRPSPDGENQCCPGWRRARLSMKPGITGLWQVLRLRAEPESDFQEWIYYDLEYARHRSLWLDWQILFHTPLAILASSRLGRFARRLARRGICVNSARVPQHD